MSDIWNILRSMPIESDNFGPANFAPTGTMQTVTGSVNLNSSSRALPSRPTIFGMPAVSSTGTRVLETVGPYGTASLPVVQKGSRTTSRAKRLVNTARGAARNATRSTFGGILGGSIGLAVGQAQMSGAVGGFDAVHNMAPRAAAELLEFAVTSGGAIGALAGASMALLNPALNNVASGTAAGVARGARRVGRKVSKTLKRTPGSRSVSIDRVINDMDNFPQIVQQIDDNVQASIADLVRQTTSQSIIPDSGPITPESFRRIIGLPVGESPALTAARAMPISLPTVPFTMPENLSSPIRTLASVAPPSGTGVAAIPMTASPVTTTTASITPSSGVAAVASGTTSTPSITGAISSTPRTPAAIIPVSTPSRVPASRMSKGTKYGIFAGGILAASVVMGARSNRSNKKEQMSQSPHPNSVRNQYVPASI